MNILKNKIIEIKNEIDKFCDTQEEIGLFTKKTGTSLFYYIYANNNNDEVAFNKASEIIDEIVNDINNNNFISSFCEGIAGFLWYLEFLNSNEFIDDDVLSSFSELDVFLESHLDVFLKEKYYDYLHGAIGIGFYFLKKAKREKKYNPILDKIVKSLIENVIIENDSAKWVSYNNLYHEHEVNLSLSHGMANILIFFCEIYELKKSEDIKIIVQKIVNYYLSKQNNINEIDSYFPNSIYENQKSFKGRFSWCYGDLGIGLALLKASTLLNDKNLELFAYEIFDFNTEKRDLEREYIVDASVCHGTCSFALIYNYLYNINPKDKYKETRDFWIKKTLEKANINDGIAGYKFLNQNDIWVNDYSLLIGIVGVGLTLMTIYYDDKSNWSECLLLN